MKAMMTEEEEKRLAEAKNRLHDTADEILTLTSKGCDCGHKISDQKKFVALLFKFDEEYNLHAKAVDNLDNNLERDFVMLNICQYVLMHIATDDQRSIMLEKLQDHKKYNIIRGAIQDQLEDMAEGKYVPTPKSNKGRPEYDSSVR